MATILRPDLGARSRTFWKTATEMRVRHGTWCFSKGKLTSAEDNAMNCEDSDVVAGVFGCSRIEVGELGSGTVNDKCLKIWHSKWSGKSMSKTEAGEESRGREGDRYRASGG